MSDTPETDVIPEAELINMANEVGFVAYGEDGGEYRIPTPAFHNRLARFYALAMERQRNALRADFLALQRALVGDTGRSAILEAERLRAELDAERKARAEAERWKDAVIDAAVVSWTYCDEDSANPRLVLSKLLAHEAKIALDPAVSSDAQALIDRGRVEAEARLIEVRRLLEQSRVWGGMSWHYNPLHPEIVQRALAATEKKL